MRALRAGIGRRLKRVGRRLSQLGGPLPDRLPDFFILGATRSGTSFLHSALAQHPDIFLPDAKELNYFNRDSRYEPELRAYRRHFGGCGDKRRAGESTPLYFAKGASYARNGVLRFDSEDDAVTRIARHIPDAQLIISLRDPATRIVSQHEKNIGQGKHSLSIDEILAAELDEGQSPMNLLYHNNYALHLRHVFDHFPEANVYILIFEEWIWRPRDALSSIQEFLQIDPAPVELEKISRNSRSRYAVRESGATSLMSPHIYRAVLNHLKPSCDYLEDRLGRTIPWTKPS